MSLKKSVVAAAILSVLATASLMAGAQTIRIANQGDALSLDPHSLNESLQLSVAANVYETLTGRNKDLSLAPLLATSWKQTSPNVWRFELRKGVQFHDGTPFTADDVVFSLTRAMTPPSNMTAYVQSIKEVKKVDDFTVDLILKGPSPVLLRELTDARIMSKAWSEKNNAVKAQDYKAKEENFASRNANGTGPYKLVSWQPDAKATLTKNETWWDKPGGNVDEVVFTPIKSAAARTAALLSGQLDFINDPPLQDLERLRANGDLKIMDGTENRTIFFGMDQNRDELLYSSVKGKNPLKDKRVRQALYQAIDIEGIRKTTMRGMSIPAGTMIAPSVHGWSKDIDARASKYDPDAAKKLLADAGYPDGFEVTLDCPNDRYVNDEAICQAVTAMWTRVGVKTRLNTQAMATYISKIQKFDTSIYMLGWGVATMDALYSLDSLVSTIDAAGGAAGNFNLGRYSNKEVDTLIGQIKVETDEKKRDVAIAQALKLLKDDYGYLPLHHQIRPWAMRKGVETVYRPDDRPVPWWTSVK